ncbi:MAG: hypothetical protein AAGC60_14210 [Acidobacteriota bacterium]
MQPGQSRGDSTRPPWHGDELRLWVGFRLHEETLHPCSQGILCRQPFRNRVIGIGA